LVTVTLCMNYMTDRELLAAQLWVIAAKDTQLNNVHDSRL